MINLKIKILICQFSLGLLAFDVFVGIDKLNTTNISWIIGNGDAFLQYIAWEFFRIAPWEYPLGLNSTYGIEISSSIVYSDSIPLMALLFKLIGKLFNFPFQYFGIWIFICFALQSMFAYKLLDIISDNTFIKSIASIFFVVSPILLWRLHYYLGHPALLSHFLILGALILSLDRKIKYIKIYWYTLLICASLIHAYILFMITILWIANILDRLKGKTDKPLNILLEILFTITSLLAVMFQAGYFLGTITPEAEGFGSNGMNLLSPFDSGIQQYFPWSYKLTPLQLINKNPEGFNFLGSGFMLMLLISLIGIKKYISAFEELVRYNLFFMFGLLVLLLIALSNKISIGAYQIYIDIPEFMLNIGNLIRSSGRMFWPIYYYIYYLVLKVTFNSFEGIKLLAILIVCIFVQIIDTSLGWMPIRASLEINRILEDELVLKNKFWIEAPKHYSKLRIIPYNTANTKNADWHLQWRIFAPYSIRNNMSTDSVRLLRQNEYLINSRISSNPRFYKNRMFENDTLYILDDLNYEKAELVIQKNIDFIGRIDGYNVLAPNYYMNFKNNVN